MKKIIISTALLLASASANAALLDSSTLSIDAGSAIYMELAPDFWYRIDINGFNGIALGTTQRATGSHAGVPDGTESPNIDNPWNFFENTAMHQTTTPVTVLSDDGAGNVELDFSGWSYTWNGIPDIPMGDGPDGGVASVTCALDCGNGDSYTLSYLARHPAGDQSGFGGVPYSLYLTGTISAVPAPAAVWLFGSGLVGLAGIVCRRKSRQRINLVV